MGQSKEEMEVCYSILFQCLVAVHVEKQMDRREVDDPCYYLLAIWSPGKISGFQFLFKHLSVVGVRRLAFLTCHLAAQGSPHCFDSYGENMNHLCLMNVVCR